MKKFLVKETVIYKRTNEVIIFYWGKNVIPNDLVYATYCVEGFKSKQEAQKKIDKEIDFWHKRDRLTNNVTHEKPADCYHIYEAIEVEYEKRA